MQGMEITSLIRHSLTKDLLIMKKKEEENLIIWKKLEHKW